jgi:hypothetical protein
VIQTLDRSEALQLLRSNIAAGGGDAAAAEGVLNAAVELATQLAHLAGKEAFGLRSGRFSVLDDDADTDADVSATAQSKTQRKRVTTEICISMPWGTDYCWEFEC